MNDVTIVGSGPTGLMLAGELALSGVQAEVLERRTSAALVGTRARGFHSRTIEILDQRGLADRFLLEGQTFPVLQFGSTPLDTSGLPSRHPYTLSLTQSRIEQLLLGWVEELGVSVRRSQQVTDLFQDEDGVEVHLISGDRFQTSYLVGADGGGSTVRKAAGIGLVGAEATRSYLIAEVEMDEDPITGIRLDEVGIHAMNATGDGAAVGVVLTERELGGDTQPTLSDLSSALTAVYGTDFGVRDPTWLSRFTDATLQATSYRLGRVLLAGDAAHVHPPTGGQGIGLGVQDAVNLGWKLAQVVRGVSSADLLDTYQSERHPATARVLKNVMIQAMLQRGDARTDALRDTIAGLAAFEEPRAHLVGLLSGLDVCHGSDEGHPVVGRRMPDLDLTTDLGPRRVFELLHEARPVLLNLDERASFDLGGWTDRVRHVKATTGKAWVLPVVGVVPAPTAVLIRPDGYVAWSGDGTDRGLIESLTAWCGPGAVA
jgi:3-(3-hydroxy-phenyl)propionate hydroxylase